MGSKLQAVTASLHRAVARAAQKAICLKGRPGLKATAMSWSASFSSVGGGVGEGPLRLEGGVTFSLFCAGTIIADNKQSH
jgi:hypothetical protein